MIAAIDMQWLGVGIAALIVAVLLIIVLVRHRGDDEQPVSGMPTGQAARPTPAPWTPAAAPPPVTPATAPPAAGTATAPGRAGRTHAGARDRGGGRARRRSGNHAGTIQRLVSRRTPGPRLRRSG